MNFSLFLSRSIDAHSLSTLDRVRTDLVDVRSSCPLYFDSDDERSSNILEQGESLSIVHRRVNDRLTRALVAMARLDETSIVITEDGLQCKRLMFEVMSFTRVGLQKIHP